MVSWEKDEIITEKKKLKQNLNKKECGLNMNMSKMMAMWISRNLYINIRIQLIIQLL
jgi:hypothetical protein